MSGGVLFTALPPPEVDAATPPADGADDPLPATGAAAFAVAPSAPPNGEAEALAPKGEAPAEAAAEDPADAAAPLLPPKGDAEAAAVPPKGLTEEEDAGLPKGVAPAAAVLGGAALLAAFGAALPLKEAWKRSFCASSSFLTTSACFSAGNSFCAQRSSSKEVSPLTRVGSLSPPMLVSFQTIFDRLSSTFSRSLSVA